MSKSFLMLIENRLMADTKSNFSSWGYDIAKTREDKGFIIFSFFEKNPFEYRTLELAEGIIKARKLFLLKNLDFIIVNDVYRYHIYTFKQWLQVMRILQDAFEFKEITFDYYKIKKVFECEE